VTYQGPGSALAAPDPAGLVQIQGLFGCVSSPTLPPCCPLHLPLQAGLHEVWGGVKPDVARDAHAAAITGTVDGCLEDAGVKPQDLTAVAVTVGPGLSICLQVGRSFDVYSVKLNV
jgi:hypothetical protein